jgi:hypothetical protein
MLVAIVRQDLAGSGRLRAGLQVEAASQLIEQSLHCGLRIARVGFKALFGISALEIGQNRQRPIPDAVEYGLARMMRSLRHNAFNQCRDRRQVDDLLKSEPLRGVKKDLDGLRHLVELMLRRTITHLAISRQHQVELTNFALVPARHQFTQRDDGRLAVTSPAKDAIGTRPSHQRLPPARGTSGFFRTNQRSPMACKLLRR